MMDQISQSTRTRPTTAAMDAAPLAIAGVVAVAAIHVVRRLSATHEDAADGRSFRQLAEEFEQDRATVRALLAHRLCWQRSHLRYVGRHDDVGPHS